MSVLEIKNSSISRILVPKTFISEVSAPSRELREMRNVIEISVESDVDFMLRVHHKERDIMYCEFANVEERIDEYIDKLEFKYRNLRSTERNENGVFVEVESEGESNFRLYFNECLKLERVGRSKSKIEIRVEMRPILILEAENACREMKLEIMAILEEPRTYELVDLVNRIDGEYLFKSIFDSSGFVAVIGKNKGKSRDENEKFYDLTGYDRIQKFINLPRPELGEDEWRKIERECVRYLIYVGREDRRDLL